MANTNVVSQKQSSLNYEAILKYYHDYGFGLASLMIGLIRAGSPEGSFLKLRCIMAQYGLNPWELGISYAELETERLVDVVGDNW